MYITYNCLYIAIKFIIIKFANSKFNCRLKMIYDTVIADINIIIPISDRPKREADQRIAWNTTNDVKAFCAVPRPTS